MTTAILDPAAPAESPRLLDKGLDVARRAAHLSHEARLLKSRAADAVEDGVHAVKRTITTARHDAEDLKDDLVYRVKREPIKAMAIVFASGVLIGAVLGWASRKAR